MAINCTLFEYLYRDAGNFKAFGAVAFDGALTEEELKAVRSRFPGDGFFIAEQLGVPALYGQLYEYSGGPIRDDHCWHEFLDIKRVNEADLSRDVLRSQCASFSRRSARHSRMGGSTLASLLAGRHGPHRTLKQVSATYGCLAGWLMR